MEHDLITMTVHTEGLFIGFNNYIESAMRDVLNSPILGVLREINILRQTNYKIARKLETVLVLRLKSNSAMLLASSWRR